VISRGRWIAGLVAVALIGTGTALRMGRDHTRYLDGDHAVFVAQFPPPPARGSPAERAELDELLALQRSRSDADVAAARADRKTQIRRFAEALGTDERTIDGLPHLARLAEALEDEAREYVRAAKVQFRRWRPHEVEPAIAPCIDDVAADQSYPSGHSTYGWLMAYLLADMVPERRDRLLARAAAFARQRMVCGVHFPSDLAAGERGAAWLIGQLRKNPGFVADRDRAARELRAALPAQGSGHSSASRAPPRLALVPAVARPRCNAAMRATIASPSPNPPVSRLRLVSSRANAWNTEARCDSGMPSPSSSTTSRHNPFSRATSMCTLRRA
jgi:acid phosphatase (class A)